MPRLTSLLLVLLLAVAPGLARATSIVILEYIHFESGSVVPKAEELVVAKEAAAALVQNPQITRVAVEGHSDNRGPEEKNVEISRKRAEWVRNYMIEQGVEPARLEVVAYGSTRPVAPNKSADNRAKNRRVGFLILEKED